MVDGFGIDERSIDGRGQVLAPWPNRLTDGRYRYGGDEVEAPINEPSRHSAIHGLVRWLNWSLVAHDQTSVTLSCAVRPATRIRVATRSSGQPMRSTPAGLDRNMQAVNVDSGTSTVRGRVPSVSHAWHGIHRRADLDCARHDLPRARQSNRRARHGSGHGDAARLHRPRRIGSTQLDRAYGNLVRGSDGRAVARLHDPDSRRLVQLWVDDAYRYLMVYTADGVARAERRRAAVAIEPMTCPPDAFRTGADLIELEPGERWQGSWGLRSDPT